MGSSRKTNIKSWKENGYIDSIVLFLIKAPIRKEVIGAFRARKISLITCYSKKKL